MNYIERWRQHAKETSDLDDIGESTYGSLLDRLSAALRSQDKHRQKLIFGFFRNKEGLERDWDR